MDFNIFKLTIDELKVLNFKGLIGFSGFCEPTLHPQLLDFIYYIKENLPEVIVAVNTNGDYLTKDLLNKYLKAKLDYLIISAYDEKVYLSALQLESPIVIIRKRFAGDMIKNNRAGSLYISKKKKNSACYYPFYMLYVDWNGDILFCSHNYDKENILGNIKENSLASVWNGPAINNLRNNQRCFAPCNKCDVIGILMGDKIYEEWQNCLSK
jgi:radical SAM protein with 4Fe4S-binding SPASM domain